jgi:hypothetical protein
MTRLKILILAALSRVLFFIGDSGARFCMQLMRASAAAERKIGQLLARQIVAMEEENYLLRQDIAETQRQLDLEQLEEKRREP